MELIRNNFIVITGGPGGGKSSLVQALSGKGFGYIHETGRSIIKERISKGLSPRPGVEEFARLMFQRDYENFLNNSVISETLFFDRSFLDSALFIQPTDTAWFQRSKDIIMNYRFNPAVFITPPWEEIYRNDDERDQSFDESVKTYEKLYTWYPLYGYKLIVLPKVSVEKRADFILNRIKLHHLS